MLSSVILLCSFILDKILAEQIGMEHNYAISDRILAEQIGMEHNYAKAVMP